MMESVIAYAIEIAGRMIMAFLALGIFYVAVAMIGHGIVILTGRDG